MKIRKILLCIVLLFSFFLTNAQDKRKIVSLKQILQKISTQHNVFFNFLENDIASFKIPEPSKEWEIAKKISYLKSETQLQFETTDNIYYSIFNEANVKKQICGYVFDYELKTPISNAVIKINNSQIAGATNEKGYFEIPFQENALLQISHLNFEKKEIQFAKNFNPNCENYFVTPQNIILEEVITQNYLARGISKKIDGSITIKPKQFGHLPGLTEPDVFKTLQQIPGVYSANESISDLNVRGGTHDQNVIYWNGIRLFQTGHFYGLISALNPNLAHTITLQKNGTSAFFGDSTSSLIDISTHNKTIENTKGAAGINLINADFYTKIKTSTQSNIEISGRRSFTDVLKTPMYSNYANRIFQNTEVKNITNNKNISILNTENFYFYDFTAQYHYQFKEKTNLYFDTILISNQLNLEQNKTEANTNVQRSSFLSQNTIGGNLHFETQWNDKNYVTFTTYVSDYKVIAENQSITNNQTFNQNNELIDLGIRLKNNFELNENWKFKLGYQFNEIGIRNIDKVDNPDYFKKIKEVLQQHAGITEIHFITNEKKLNAIIGTRVNYFEKFSKTIIEPRLQLSYKLNATLFFEILAEAKNQTVSQVIDLHNDFLGLEKRRWVVANNKDIPISISNQISAGSTFKKNNWLLTFDAYYKSVSGINSRSQGFQNQLEFVTIPGKYVSFGTEILIQKKIQKFTNWITHSFMKNDYNFSNFNPNTFPNNFEIAHFINAGSIFENKKLQLALGAKFKTGKPATNTLSDKPIINNNKAEILYSSPNSDNLVANIQVQLSGGYSFFIAKKNKLQVGLAVENLLNSNYNINEFYRINTNTYIIEKVNTNTLLRTVNAFARFSF